GTALYDSLVFAAQYFFGVKGQKALLLLSDGEDEASRFGADEALETARRAGVLVYAIGLKEAAARRTHRQILERLARETGGRAFFVADTAELPAVYAAIQTDLRSQYLLAYQSSSTRPITELRSIEVQVEGGYRVRAMSGYYP
ncbi:MAG: VWA domain-containing protein, partial [Acidobacteriota bacterium]